MAIKPINMALVYEIFVGYAHAVWWWTQPDSLSKTALQTIISPYNQIFVSPINLWKVSIKYHKGKWDEAKLVIRDFEKLV